MNAIPGPAAEPPVRAPMLTVEQALATILERARPIEAHEEVPVSESLGRVLAAEVRAPFDVPGHANSQMDGYAVRGADAAAAGEVRLRVTQRIAAGQTGTALGPGEAARIFTGAPVPDGADTVVAQEDCTVDGADVLFPGPLSPGRFVRPRGNDIAAGALVLAPGTRVRPQEMGLASSLGLASLTVRRRLRVAIVSTGDELIQPGEPLRPGAIYNSNRYTLIGLLAGLGCELVDLGTVEDAIGPTVEALRTAARRADVLVTTGGVSVGEEDHLRHAVEQAGHLDLWRVAVKPGKPLAFGRVGDLDVLGLPGNPVSTLVTFCLFVRPFLLRRLGVEAVEPRRWPVRAGFDRAEPGTRREFVRARLEDGPDGPVAHLYAKQGSDVLTSASWADGLVELREGERVSRGELVPYIGFPELLC